MDLRNKKIFYLSISIALVLSFCLGFFAKSWFFTTKNFLLEIRGGATSFVNPLLECENSESIKEISTFENKIQDTIDSIKKNDNSVRDVSVYFRDLNNGPWFGINERTEFSPASLLKVPIMMAYFKEAEKNPDILKKKLVFNPQTNSDTMQNFAPEETLDSGKSYTVDELIKRMIVYSENNAKNLLITNAKDFYENVYTDLGILIPGTRGVEDFMSVKEYASFFRILYNASYLNKFYSNKALELLSQVDFKNGLVAGVPNGIVVSHKFGERGIDNIRQLHDCGIIYEKNHPYLLCVMTRGFSFSSMSAAIQKISHEVFSFVSEE